jgi:NitT/TauT family transport system substrate-binding protein
MIFTRRTALALLAAAALPRQSTAREPFRLVVTNTEVPVVPNSVIELAKSLGYYAREGVSVEIVRVQQTPSAVAALASGRAEMANVSVDAVLQLTARRQLPLKAVLSPNKSLPFLIAGDREIPDVPALAGKAFGVGRVGSLDHSLSTLVLRKHGLDTSTVRFVSLGQPNVRAQALAAGRIDATTMSIGVWLALGEKERLKVLVPEDAYHAAAPVLNKVNVVPDRALSERREEVAAVTRAILRASRDFAREPRLWADAMAKDRADLPGADLDTLAAAYRTSWSVNGGLNRDELAFTTDWIFGTQDFADLPKPALQEWVDFSILESVLSEIGVDPATDPPLHS